MKLSLKYQDDTEVEEKGGATIRDTLSFRMEGVWRF